MSLQDFLPRDTGFTPDPASESGKQNVAKTTFHPSPSNFNNRGGMTMAKIIWETRMEKALARAKAENKPILLDFFNPL